MRINLIESFLGVYNLIIEVFSLLINRIFINKPNIIIGLSNKLLNLD